MASQSGTIMATPPTTYGHDLLLDAFITFITTNATLVSLGQNWTLLNDNHAAWNADRFVYLKGPGLAASDQIFVQIRRYSVTGVAQPVYNWQLRGAQGYDSALSFDNQPGVSKPIELILYDEDIPYWFFANGRRFVINARVLSIHSNCYCGLYLPYATQPELRYPLIMLGMSEFSNVSYLSTLGTNFNGFFYPKTSNAGIMTVTPGHVLKRDGTWTGVCNDPLNQIADTYRTGKLWPYYDGGMNIRPSEGGIVSEFPILVNIFDSSERTYGSCYGELDGVRWICGGPYVEQEDIIQINSVNYRAISDAHRIALNNMAAVLED